MRQTLDQAQSSIPPLQLKVQELEHNCSIKDNELEELRSWRDRVLKSMGLASEPVLAHEVSKLAYQHVPKTQHITETHENDLPLIVCVFNGPIYA